MTDTEKDAIAAIRNAGGALLVSQIPDRNDRDIFGNLIPGMGVYLRLAKRNIVFFTEEEPITLENGTSIELTPSVCLVEGAIE